MMIMKVFPNKLPSRITQYAQSLAILSAVESEINIEFCWPSAVWFRITENVESDVSTMA